MTRASRAPWSIAASILGVVIAGTGGLLLAGRVGGRSNPGAAEVSVFKREAMAVIRFQGAPRGGGLTISVKGRRLQIDTRPGERLERIAARAAALINADREMSRQQITARCRRLRAVHAADRGSAASLRPLGRQGQTVEITM